MRLNEDDFLVEIGLGRLSPEAVATLRKHNNERLDFNVEMRIKAMLSQAEYKKFEAFFKHNNAAGAFDYLKTVLPAYQSIVEAETKRLEAQLAGEASAILAIEIALAGLQDVYEKHFADLDGCGGREPPLAS
jgi:hypothetical protein